VAGALYDAAGDKLARHAEPIQTAATSQAAPAVDAEVVALRAKIGELVMEIDRKDDKRVA
jgi:hypothetical protein